jgi:outer membrane murein-binding lipoprotein Lpp
MTDGYTKVILTIIAVSLIWIAVNQRASASNEVTTNDLSDQIASVGSAVDNLQQSVDDIASNVIDIKNREQE